MEIRTDMGTHREEKNTWKGQDALAVIVVWLSTKINIYFGGGNSKDLPLGVPRKFTRWILCWCWQPSGQRAGNETQQTTRSRESYPGFWQKIKLGKNTSHMVPNKQNPKCLRGFCRVLSGRYPYRVKYHKHGAVRKYLTIHSAAE
jgi:hypothetical protein